MLGCPALGVLVRNSVFAAVFSATLVTSGTFAVAQTNPVPPPPDAVVTFYVSVDNQASGPFSVADIKKRMASGDIARDAYVVKTGESEWRKATEVSDFQLPASAEEATTYLIGSWTSKPVDKEGVARTLFLLFGRSGLGIVTERSQKSGAEPDNNSNVGPWTARPDADGVVLVEFTIGKATQQRLTWQSATSYRVTVNGIDYEMNKD